MKPIHLKRAIRFSFTGIFNTAIHIIITTIIIEYILFYPPIANGIAFIGTTYFSYYVNTVWTFSDKLDNKTLFRFCIVSLIGLLFATIIPFICYRMGFHYFIGIFCVILTVPAITFLLHSIWTYK